MLPPQESHLLNGDSFGLREEHVDEDRHHGDPPREEEEDPELEGAEQGQERLRDDEGE